MLCSQSPPKLCGPRVFLWLVGWLQQVWLVGKHAGGVEQDEELVLKEKKVVFLFLKPALAKILIVKFIIWDKILHCECFKV